MNRVQIVTLHWDGDVPTVYIDIVGSEDAEESLFAMDDHINDGEKAKIEYKFL
jgi:hypothetical protein|tara:strand:+ start:428 stop:586 length:159 start_codon:yes stop_codon:yes gene_type:complete